MANNVKIMALGGLDESGNDCYVIEINNDIFVLEAGSKVPDKTIPGVDFLLPNMDYLVDNKDRIVGYFMTHGHDENMGALQYLYPSAPAPIYCTHATQVVMDAEAYRFKLKPNFNYRIVNPSDVLNINGREVKLFQTVHNAAYSFGVSISTSKGNVVYTGDYIVDFNTMHDAYYFDLKAIEDIATKPTLVLLAESKAANKEGYCAPNHSIYTRLSKHFRDGHKRIFITCFWQNEFRINEICKLCKDFNKKIYFYNDYTADVMNMLMKADKTINLEQKDILNKEDILRTRSEDIVILLLGRGDKLYLELQKLVYRTNEDKRIVLGQDDIFINVAIPTQALETLATRSMDALYRVGCDVVWVKSKSVSSMHAHQSDLKFFLALFKPKYYFPVRGSFVNLMSNAKLALSLNCGYNHSNIFILDNGMQIVFNDSPRPQILMPEQNNIQTPWILII